MKIKNVPIDKINPAPYNPRRDLSKKDKSYKDLEKSLNEFGNVEPLIWNKQTGNLVGGHQRLRILKDRGETEVEVSVVDLPLEKEKALNLALNKISGDWDNNKLAELFAEFDDSYLDLTGFGMNEVDSLLSSLNSKAHFDVLISEADREEGTTADETFGESDEEGNYYGDVAVDDGEYNRTINAVENSGDLDSGSVNDDYDEEEPDQYFIMRFSVTNDERKIVNEAINFAKQKFEVSTSPEAFVAIVKNWLEENCEGEED